MTRKATPPKDPAPRTLREAHEVLVRLRPAPEGAPLSEWQAFHAMSARVYAEVAEVDRGHHHEALNYWAARERQSADEIAGLIARQKTDQAATQS
jgi:hypothetical protein